jgi:rare lipoprotein A
VNARRAIYVSSLALVAHGCTEAPKPALHYVLGPSYQAGTLWYYPRESYDLDETGLAAVMKGSHTPLTTDGEVFDKTALAASHPTLQLPAIARVTNLDNGLQVTVRVNDRGSGDPHRLLELTPHAATLLGMQADGVAPIRLQVLQVESRTATEGLPGAPTLAMTAAPRDAVSSTELLPPEGVRQGKPSKLAANAKVAEPVEAAAVPTPMRLPDAVVQTVPRPGRMMVRLDTFDSPRYAATQQAKMSSAGARIVPSYNGRRRQYRVEIGPFQTVSQADAVLDQALARGIPDARIVVDQ